MLTRTHFAHIHVCAVVHRKTSNGKDALDSKPCDYESDA